MRACRARNHELDLGLGAAAAQGCVRIQMARNASKLARDGLAGFQARNDLPNNQKKRNLERLHMAKNCLGSLGRLPKAQKWSGARPENLQMARNRLGGFQITEALLLVESISNKGRNVRFVFFGLGYSF